MKTNFFGVLLLILSVVPLTKGAAEVYIRYRVLPTTYAAEQSAQYIQSNLEMPIKLTISSITLNSPITTTKDTWVYPENSLVYLQNSVLPGQKGNTVIYGHNFKSLLGDLNKTKIGDKIEIQLTSGKVITYAITNTYTVTPDQTHILNATTDARLTLFTCSGFLDSKRLVVIAKQINP
ncbi:MAG: hypothetical protein RLY61_882 [Candidatus Parcubacteria bacterium]|jgi:LPXTG-site transpeptidase (sortase) family protein